MTPASSSPNTGLHLISSSASVPSFASARDHCSNLGLELMKMDSHDQAYQDFKDFSSALDPSSSQAFYVSMSNPSSESCHGWSGDRNCGQKLIRTSAGGALNTSWQVLKMIRLDSQATSLDFS